MAPQKDFEELIDLYLSGKMNESEIQSFEAEINSNPELKSELNFQSELVEGIKTFRQNELKAMLNNVSVGSGSTSFVSLNLAATGFISLFLIVGSVLVYNQYFSADPEHQFELTVENAEVMPESLHTPAIPTPKSTDLASSTADKEIEEVQNQIIALGKVEDKNKKKQIEKSHEVILPDMAMDEGLQEIGIDTDSESDLGYGARLSDNINKTEIENKVAAGYNFHYQYFNNKLYLYGDFTGNQYELLEIEFEGSTKLYFYFEGKYHRIISDTKEVTMLRPLRNEKTIKELQSLREKNK